MGEVISMVEQELNSVIKAVKDRVIRATIQKRPDQLKNTKPYHDYWQDQVLPGIDLGSGPSFILWVEVEDLRCIDIKR